MANGSVTVQDGSGRPVDEAADRGEAVEEVDQNNPPNPLGEETVEVFVTLPNGLYSEGFLMKPNQKYDLPISAARNAYPYLASKNEDGSLGPLRIPDSGPKQVARSVLEGRPLHERIGALEQEEEELAARLEEVRKRKDFERSKIQATKAQPDAPKRSEEPAQDQPAAKRPRATEPQAAPKKETEERS